MSYYFSYSAKALAKQLKDNLMTVTYEKLYNKNKLHCTMLYSNETYQENYNQLKLPNIEVCIKGIEFWQTDNGYVVVATLDSQEVIKMHNEIKEQLNIKHDKPFNPHITLQKLSPDEKSEMVKLEELSYLVGQKVQLTNFKFHIVEPKPKLKM